VVTQLSGTRLPDTGSDAKSGGNDTLVKIRVVRAGKRLGTLSGIEVVTFKTARYVYLAANLVSQAQNCNS
jgi:hypothetical protein